MKKVFVSLALAAVVAVGCNTQPTTVKGKDGKELSLNAPEKVAIDREGTAEVKIHVERKNFDEPVKIEFKDLPAGVVVVEDDHKMDKGVKERTFTLKATDEAKVSSGNAVKVVASGGDMNATRQLVLDIREGGKGHVSGSSPAAADEKLKKDREALNASVKKKMDEIDESMKVLRAKAKDATGQVKEDVNKDLQHLEQQRQELGKQYLQIQETAARDWSSFSARLNTAASDLSEGVSKAMKRFQK